jgi:sulfur relay (sulfurtransferase) complex TusBCD TusD component (DsrE family)
MCALHADTPTSIDLSHRLAWQEMHGHANLKVYDCIAARLGNAIEMLQRANARDEDPMILMAVVKLRTLHAILDMWLALTKPQT